MSVLAIENRARASTQIGRRVARSFAGQCGPGESSHELAWEPLKAHLLLAAHEKPLKASLAPRLLILLFLLVLTFALVHL